MSEELDAHSMKTAEAIRRFNDVFQRYNPAALIELVTEDCVIGNTVPAPNVARYVGREACIGLWQGIAIAQGTHFDVEEVFVAGDRAIIRWRYRWGEGEINSVRGAPLA